MTPIKLTFQAFGPYVKKQEVDFTKFTDSGVFLIHGITGSGKTTILDAITYALYGKSSGGQRGDITAMRCQMANEDIPTEVEFIFKISERTYKFIRSINIRTKRNGNKDYNITQNAMFLSRDNIFVPFFENPKIKDVEQKAWELMGLTHEQFIQVIMLPQGKFEKLLMAKSDEKEEILVTLFNAEKWQEAAEWICEQAKNIARDITIKRENIKVLLKSENAEDVENLRIQETELKMTIENTLKEKQEKVQLLISEKNKYQLKKDLYNLFEEKNRSEKELFKIKEQEKYIDSIFIKLEKGKMAINVYQKYSSAMNIYKQLQDITSKLKKEQENNLNCIAEREKISLALENLKKNEEHIDSIRKNKMKYEALIEVYKEISLAGREANIETTALEKLMAENKIKQQNYDISKKKLQDYTIQKDFIFNSYSMRLPELRDKSEKFIILDKKNAEHKKISLEIDKINNSLEELKNKLEENKLKTAAQKFEYDRAYNQYIEEAACLIGEALQEGQECPVCGSTSHPKKARKIDSASDTSYIKTLSLKLDQLKDEGIELVNLTAKQDVLKSSKAEKLQSLQSEINELNKFLSNFTKEEITETLKRAEAETSRLNTIINEETRLTSRLNKLDRELAELNINISEQSRLKEEKTARFNSLMERRIAEISSEADLISKINELGNEIEQYDKELKIFGDRMTEAEKMLSSSTASLNYMKEHVENKKVEYETGKTEYYELLYANGFKDTAEFKQYLTEQQQLDDWNKEIQDYVIEKGSIERNLERLVTLTRDKEKPDIEAAVDLIEKLEQSLTECEKLIALNTEKEDRINRIIKKTEKEQALLQELIRKYDMYYSFGTTLRGDKGISLRRYVLGVMLTSVTVEANRLLKNVHDGRYQLCRTLEGSGRTRKAGLELEVFDAYSGEKRGVAGLSGGEKFLVSLALSLGLSAVVQSQSGGIRIDTMFIDEGFGSLDRSSINDALNILSSVKGSKRLVGIISHVQLLKETIESGISVEKSRKGSTLIING